MKKKIVWLIFILMALLMAGCSGSDSDSSSAKNDNGYDYTYGTLDFPALNNFGIVALNNTNSICILDGNTLKISEPLLNHELGSYGGGLFDVAIAPDGKTAMVSNFGDSMVYFIDTSDPSSPHVKGNAQIDFFAEDMAVTPNGKYLLVTNGGFANRIAVVDLKSMDMIRSDAPDATLYHNAVSVAPDGRTVITADYFQSRVNVFTLSNSGNLTHRKTIDLMETGDVEGPRPVNLEISPDGKTVIVASANAPLVFPILTIQGPGDVVLSDIVKQSEGLRGAQSVAFNRAGTKAYVHCTTTIPEHRDYDGNAIAELQKNFIGKWEVTKTIPVDFFGTSQLFGVDTLAINDTNGYLYVSNPTVSGGTPYVLVVDVNQGKVIQKLKTENAPDDVYPPSDPDFMSIPTGISFWNKR